MNTSKYKNGMLYLILALMFFSPLFIWSNSLGHSFTLFSEQSPPGQSLYIFSKLAGLYAIFFVCAQITLKCIEKNFFRINQKKLHVATGISILSFLLTHIGLFMTAVAVRGNHIPFHLLGLNFNSGYYNSMVSLGALAFWLCIGTTLAGIISLRGRKFARIIHFLAYPLTALALIHSLTIGTETRNAFLSLIYVMMTLSLVLLIVNKGRRQLAESNSN